MITSNNNESGIKYEFGSNELQINDKTDKTKNMVFDLSQLNPNSTISLTIPPTSGQIVTLGANFMGFSVSLTNSQIIILDSKIKSTSIVTISYNNVISNLNSSSTGDLYVDNINPYSSFTIKSNKANDNNSIYIIVIY